MGSSASRKQGKNRSKGNVSQGSEVNVATSDREHEQEEERRQEEVVTPVEHTLEDKHKEESMFEEKELDMSESEVKGDVVASQTSMEPKDIMISYSHQDKDKMRLLKDALEAEGITVWVDEVGLQAGVEFLNKIGQAIVDAKLFLSILSCKSVTSKYCRDELALAYVSSKPIFPCTIESRDKVTKGMDFGMRLQLAPLRWFSFTNDKPFEAVFKELTKEIKNKIIELNDGQEKKDEPKKTSKPQLKRLRSKLNIHHRQLSVEGKYKDFWMKFYPKLDFVTWKQFVEDLKSEYATEIEQWYKEGDLDWLIQVLHREMDEDEDEIIHKDHYEEFCTVSGERQEFWQRVQEQALESYTMREVFSMNSSVRIDAIQNLAKFNSSSVIESLLDLCVDVDENVRAVAAISLARTGVRDNDHVINTIMKLLKDQDRLVRESGCLALGHIKAKKAIPKLVDMWRNDAISNVREAAAIALEQIGGDEAQKAMHITKVLSEEIKALSNKH
ncbi:uncharacterized protein LOC117121896 [Anneissia japonica]|uniref:uncharacterized protein LOC117121896 n=1 Tax=Anneissia japonica TaxID=1529436 RepID=UPI0014256844|nr:uncharacterized protein LOC117121896 [Anneissia japonica]XP_033123180.1 uncharacterized protein LOC117121896 [Anneissia japonica]XP_033123181.1 uncharacterized protein LOC117121896 [Anneissia japonica]